MVRRSVTARASRSAFWFPELGIAELSPQNVVTPNRREIIEKPQAKKCGGIGPYRHLRIAPLYGSECRPGHSKPLCEKRRREPAPQPSQLDVPAKVLQRT
ncbi:MAG: hypothetical protein ACI9WU_002256 [Myxococcota bacterium]|jgi:hypothetical protein